MRSCRTPGVPNRPSIPVIVLTICVRGPSWLKLILAICIWGLLMLTGFWVTQGTLFDSWSPASSEKSSRMEVSESNFCLQLHFVWYASGLLVQNYPLAKPVLEIDSRRMLLARTGQVTAQTCVLDSGGA